MWITTSLSSNHLKIHKSYLLENATILKTLSDIYEQREQYVTQISHVSNIHDGRRYNWNIPSIWNTRCLCMVSVKTSVDHESGMFFLSSNLIAHLCESVIIQESRPQHGRLLLATSLTGWSKWKFTWMQRRVQRIHKRKLYSKLGQFTGDSFE